MAGLVADSWANHPPTLNLLRVNLPGRSMRLIPNSGYELEGIPRWFCPGLRFPLNPGCGLNTGETVMMKRAGRPQRPKVEVEAKPWFDQELAG
jgi:hypothetical protein